jgi:hypothetical protein
MTFQSQIFLTSMFKVYSLIFSLVVCRCYRNHSHYIPFKFQVTDNKTNLLDPAIQETLSILESALKSPSVKQVIITSSVVTVLDVYSPPSIFLTILLQFDNTDSLFLFQTQLTFSQKRIGFHSHMNKQHQQTMVLLDISLFPLLSSIRRKEEKRLSSSFFSRYAKRGVFCFVFMLLLLFLWFLNMFFHSVT